MDVDPSQVSLSFGRGSLGAGVRISTVRLTSICLTGDETASTHEDVMLVRRGVPINTEEQRSMAGEVMKDYRVRIHVDLVRSAVSVTYIHSQTRCRDSVAKRQLYGFLTFRQNMSTLTQTTPRKDAKYKSNTLFCSMLYYADVNWIHNLNGITLISAHSTTCCCLWLADI